MNAARLWRFVVPTLAVLLLSGSAAIAGNALTPQDQEGPRFKSPTPKGPVPGFSDDMKKRFGALKKAHEKAGDLRRGQGEDLVGDVTGLGGSYGLNPDPAVPLRRTPDGTDVVAVPGDQALCIRGGKVGVSCIKNDRAGRGFDTATCGAIPDGVVAIYGPVPDGAVDVQVTQANGGALPGDVQGNYLYVEVPVPDAGSVPTFVSWQSPAGSESFRVPGRVPAVCARG